MKLKKKNTMNECVKSQLTDEVTLTENGKSQSRRSFRVTRTEDVVEAITVGRHPRLLPETIILSYHISSSSSFFKLLSCLKLIVKVLYIVQEERKGKIYRIKKDVSV